MRCRYYVEPRSPLVLTAACLFAVSSALRIGWWPLSRGSLTPYLTVTRGVLPLTAAVLFVPLIFRYGRKTLRMTFIPTLMGVVFFILKAADFAPWHRALCTVLYLSVAALYGAAVFGILPIKKLLIPLFGLPLAFHVFVEDLFINRAVYDLAGWLQEGSVFCIMAGLLCVSLALKKE